MPDHGIAFERRDHVAIVTLNRPERLNTFDEAMFANLESVAATLAEQPPRAVVITGAGERAFRCQSRQSHGGRLGRRH